MKSSLQEYFLVAKQGAWALPHFNFSTLAQLNGICDVARELRVPMLLGTSEGERKFLGLQQVVALIRSFQAEGLLVFLNADHCHSIESALEAFEAGYDSIHVDFSKKPWEENLKDTKKVVEHIKSRKPEIHVEGELGYLVTDSSKIYEKEVLVPEESYTKPEEAKKFVAETGVDRLAPAVGTIHGIAKNTPKLRFDLIEALRNMLPEEITLVLHGGSGVTDEETQKAVHLGFNNVHVSTELRVAYTKALRHRLEMDPDEVTPYKYLDNPRRATSELVRQKLEIFGTKPV